MFSRCLQHPLAKKVNRYTQNKPTLQGHLTKTNYNKRLAITFDRESVQKSLRNYLKMFCKCYHHYRVLSQSQVKVPCLAIGKKDGTQISSIGLWVTQLRKHSECYSGWPSGSTMCFTPMLFPKALNAKQGNGMYHFLSLWYDSTGYQTLTYQVQSKHSTIEAEYKA